MKIKVFNSSTNDLPQYATPQSAGMDLRADIKEPITLQPTKSVLVPTGLHIQLPAGYEAQIRPRSGLALKHGITVLNSPGTIDADYRGDIGVILINHGDEPFVINKGERIAQMVITKCEQANWIPCASLSELNSTERGDGGYGHSGTH